MTSSVGKSRNPLVCMCSDKHSVLLHLPALLSVSLHQPSYSRWWTMEN